MKPHVLVNPAGMEQSCYTPPPLGLLYLAAMDPATVIYDAALLGNDGHAYLDSFPEPGYLGVPVYTPARNQAFELLRYGKSKGWHTVAGGPHIGAMPKGQQEHYPFVDSWVLADGEAAWQRIVAGEEIQVDNTMAPDLNALPIPAWERIDIYSYPPRAHVGERRGINMHIEPRIPLVFGRGCAGSCTFCSTWWIHGKYRHHSLNWMIQQFNVLHKLGAKHLCFNDDCLTSDREASLKLFEAMKQYNFVWFGTTRVDCIDDEIAQAAADAGCYELSFGIESGSPAMLKRMHKHTDLEAAYSARDACRKAGIFFCALTIQGFPHETERDRQLTSAMLTRLGAEDGGSVGHTMVLPGTALYQECKRAGLISDDFWLGPERYYTYRGGL